MKQKINKILCNNAIEEIKLLDKDLITLVFTSVPYNVNASKWSYNSHNDNQPYLDYLIWLKDIFTECYRVIRKGGRVIINIDAMTNRQEDKQDEYIRPIYADVVNFMKEIGFKFYGEHIWYKSSSEPINMACPHCSKQISIESSQWTGRATAWGSYKNCSHPVAKRGHEYLLVFSKEQFRLDKTSESLDSDLTKEEFLLYINSVWTIQPETRKILHPCPFPVELPLRAIKLYSYPNDIILDPFLGSGTTCLAAKIAKRRYIGIDIDEGYCKIARERIETESKNVFEE